MRRLLQLSSDALLVKAGMLRQASHARVTVHITMLAMQPFQFGCAFLQPLGAHIRCPVRLPIFPPSRPPHLNVVPTWLHEWFSS